ncbi:hypothetical protein HXZ94_15665 [Empedobacter falsenii]|uniref:hypothetical protein n=2 Tax=Weeksellaceae TaxID=2762318 RepID=UPI0025789F79|nr:hypothetical protein [Empedobacter falsenii]MDM1299933.1 hypothetical protein [Empedobacter falsenii]MDM1319726.1 hypothetical protein [Empedobacter falsenii]
MKKVKIKYLMPNEPVKGIEFEGDEIRVEFKNNFTNFYIIKGELKHLKAFRNDILVSYELDHLEDKDTNMHTV